MSLSDQTSPLDNFRGRTGEDFLNHHKKAGSALFDSAYEGLTPPKGHLISPEIRASVDKLGGGDRHINIPDLPQYARLGADDASPGHPRWHQRQSQNWHRRGEGWHQPGEGRHRGWHHYAGEAQGEGQSRHPWSHHRPGRWHHPEGRWHHRADRWHHHEGRWHRGWHYHGDDQSLAPAPEGDPNDAPASLRNWMARKAIQFSYSNPSTKDHHGLGNCTRIPKETYQSLGMPIGSMSGVEQGQYLESTGLFRRISAAEAGAGDFGFRHWSPSVIAQWGKDCGDAFIITGKAADGQLFGTSGAVRGQFAVPPDGDRYTGLTILRPTAEFYRRYGHGH